MHTRRRIPQLWTALVTGTAGLVLLAVPAHAQVDLTGPTGTEPVEQTIEGAVDEVGTTVTTLVETVDEAVDDTGDVADDGVAVDLPGASVEANVPDLLTDPVGSLDGQAGDDAAPEPSSVSGTETVRDSAESARADGAPAAGSPDGDDGTTADHPRGGQAGVVPGVVATRSRPFVLTARDVGTFGLPLVVAGLLCAYLGMDSWMRRREPATVPVVEDRDERLRFE